tara:strand:+ start:1450 stop:2397 length:948 start_codon:yes stop_codon:yes gene_type:complete
MKQAIVTGATGYIGSYFVEYLTKKGIEVLALGRKDFDDISKIRQKKLKDSKYLKIDMSKIENLKNLIKEIHWNIGSSCVFINLAWGGKSKLSDLNVRNQMMNVIWCVNAFKIANDLNCIKFLQIGTMEEAFTHKYLTLDYKKNNEYNRHVIYSVAKIAAKKALQLFAKDFKTDLIYVLHSHVMAPDDDKDSFLQVTLKKLIDKSELVFSTGEQTFDVISEKDCANGYFLICEKGIKGSEYWVGSGDPRPLREYVERMYALYPSGKEMQFGKFKYNDVKLSKNDFSIENLVKDTGYKPQNSYEEIVSNLYESLIRF